MTKTTGLVLHRAWLYDFTVWLWTRGRERAFREKLLAPARLVPGESVLDVGCGTGSLAIAAKQRVGASGVVCGIDASPEMIARARRKARRVGVDVGFQQATAEALPFPDARFDVVLSTVMLHHLPRPVRERFASEARRVLKPGGRLVAVDFAEKSTRGHRHGGMSFDELMAVVGGAGLRAMDNGDLGRGLQFVVARS